MTRVPKKYTFIQVNHAKLSDVEELYRISYGVSPTLGDLQKKYDTNALGLDFVGCIAYSDQYEPGAYYGVFPMRFILNGKSVLAAQSGDTMTSPLHRMKGLFVESALRAYAIAARSKVRFVFGFPNENSYPGFKSKLNWQFTGNMQNFNLKYRLLPLAAIAKRFGGRANRVLSPFLLRRLRKYSVSIENLETLSIQANGEAKVQRDRAFLEYKLRNGSEVVSIEGFQMLVKIDGALLIGDCRAFEPDQFGRYLEAVRKLAKKTFCHKVIFSLSEKHWLHSYFIRHGHAPHPSLPIGFLPFNGFETQWNDITFGRLDYDTF